MNTKSKSPSSRTLSTGGGGKKDSPKVQSVQLTWETDQDPDISYLDEKDDKARLAAFRREDWWMIGVRASAVVIIEGIAQTLHSGGLWGIESDMSERQLKNYETEQYNELVGVLKGVGVKTTQIPPLKTASVVRKF